MRRRFIAASVALLTIAAAAGCSGSDTPRSGNGTPAAGVSLPASTSPSESAAALPHSGAPKVPAPLPASVLAGDPCTEALTSEQVRQALGTVPEAEPEQLPIGRKCGWRNTVSRAQIAVFYNVNTRAGLSSVYQNIKPVASVWRELPPIQQLPAVAHDSTTAKGQPADLCTVSVGVADDLSFDVGIFLSEANRGKTDPCAGATRVAEMVVTNLRQKAGA